MICPVHAGVHLQSHSIEYQENRMAIVNRCRLVRINGRFRKRAKPKPKHRADNQIKSTPYKSNLLNSGKYFIN